MTEPVLAKMQFLVAGAVLIGILSTVYLETSARPPKPAQAIAVGMKLRAPQGYSWPSDKPTLVLVLRVGCVHCENEMSFYEHLLDLEKNEALDSHLVAFFPNSEADVEGAFSSRLNGLQKIANVEMQSLNVTGTPTLLVVDRGGVVRSVWLGELPSDQKKSLSSALSHKVNEATRWLP